MILVTGVNGVVGKPLCEKLSREGLSFLTVSRKSNSEEQSALQWDLHQPASPDVLQRLAGANISTVIHCAPLWFLPAHLASFKEIGINRIVAFSSSSLIAKRNSQDSSENHLVKQLSESEADSINFCKENDIALTILRPSMIYGYQLDENITHIAKFIQRYRFIALAGKAQGLRQPVHADDLVNASVAILENAKTYGNTYNLAGKDAMSYKQMIKAIFDGLGQTPRIIHLPLWLYRLALRVAAMSGRFSYTAEMADRMSQNLNYEYFDAEQDFNFRPQAFLNNPQQDLPQAPQ